MPLFMSGQKEKAWLMQVTVNRCKDMLRGKLGILDYETGELALLSVENDYDGCVYEFEKHNRR